MLCFQVTGWGTIYSDHTIRNSNQSLEPITTP